MHTTPLNTSRVTFPSPVTSVVTEALNPGDYLPESDSSLGRNFTSPCLLNSEALKCLLEINELAHFS